MEFGMVGWEKAVYKFLREYISNFSAPKKREGEQIKEMLMVPGCWTIGEQVCAAEWVSSELEAFKRD